MKGGDPDHSRIPRHLQLRRNLLRRWKAAGVRPGDRIESQNEITRCYDFSLITVVKTLRDLESEGVIRREVGKGSYLQKAPWAAPWHRIAFFYNRDVVGGGIFRNPFYTALVMAFEQKVIADGHSFTLSSFTDEGARLSDIDAPDAAALAAVRRGTNLGFIDRATSRIVLLDQVIDHPSVLCFRIDCGPAFMEMARALPKAPQRLLYLDTVIDSSERDFRLEGVRHAANAAPEGSRLEVLRVNPEIGGSAGAAPVLEALERNGADVVFGHMSHDWLEPVSGLAPGARLYPIAPPQGVPGLHVDMTAWMAEMLPAIYAGIDDRSLPGRVHSFSATFQP